MAEPSPVRAVVVLGAGTMGHGIACAAIASGFETALYDVAQEAIDGAVASVDRILEKSVELGKTPASELP